MRPVRRHQIERNGCSLAGLSLRVWSFITTYQADHGLAPSIAEIRTALEIPSTSTAHYHLERLAEAGVIDRIPRISRGIVLREPFPTAPHTDTQEQA